MNSTTNILRAHGRKVLATACAAGLLIGLEALVLERFEQGERSAGHMIATPLATVTALSLRP